MAPAIAGTVAVDRAVELAKHIQNQMDNKITSFKITEDYDVVPIGSPEPGLECNITPRGVLVVGGLVIGSYIAYQAFMSMRAWLAQPQGLPPVTTNLNELAGAMGGININPIVKWLMGFQK